MPYIFSVIIPHKNIPKLLVRCLASIPQRDDLEVIIVDDNSDPNIVDFEHFPGKDSPNTTVVLDKSGKGAGRARNIGLNFAKGKWVIFADADDLFSSQFVNILDQICKSEDELIYFKTDYRDSMTMKPVNEDHTNFIIDDTIKYGFDKIRYQILVPWGKIYSSELIRRNNIRFEECRYGNDTWFSALCGYYAKRLSVSPIKGYCYMVRDDSLWHAQSLEWANCRFKTGLRLFIFMKKKGKNDAANHFKGVSRYFLDFIKKYSKLIYLYRLFVYYWYTRICLLHIIIL